MPVRDTAVGAFVAGDPLSAATSNDGPGGMLGYLHRTTDSDGVDSGNEVVMTLSSVPINTARGVLVIVQGIFRLNHDGGFQVILQDSSGTIRIWRDFVLGRDSSGTGIQD